MNEDIYFSFLLRVKGDVNERTTSDVAQRQKAVHDVTQEVEFSQEVVAVGPSLSKDVPALPVRSSEFVVADVSNVHEEVEDIPESASCKGQRSKANKQVTRELSARDKMHKGSLDGRTRSDSPTWRTLSVRALMKFCTLPATA